MIFWECCSSYCKGTTVKYSRYGRTGPDRPPQPTTQRILPQLGRGWRVGEPRKCYAPAWTGGRDTSFYLVTVHHGQKLLTIVVLLTIAAAFFEGRLGQFELLVSRPSLQIFEFLELKYNHY